MKEIAGPGEQNVVRLRTVRGISDVVSSPLFKFILNWFFDDFNQVEIFRTNYFCTSMTENLKSLALTYKTAPLEIREQVSLNELAAKQLLNFIRDYSPATDALVVSTCNRTEIYYLSGRDLSNEIFKGIRLIKKPTSSFEEHFTRYEGAEAVRHLFHVAIGLDAQVIGDLQISGQIKNAYQWSADEGMAGPFLHRLMHTIFFANKRIVQETSFRDGAASLSYAAKELAEDLTLAKKNPTALVIGVGEIGQDVCLNLVDSRFSSVTIINRTIEKAEKLAQKCGFIFKGIESLRGRIEERGRDHQFCFRKPAAD